MAAAVMTVQCATDTDQALDGAVMMQNLDYATSSAHLNLETAAQTALATVLEMAMET